MTLGTFHAELGDLANAIRYLERALLISPESERIARNLEATRTLMSDRQIKSQLALKSSGLAAKLDRQR